MSTRARTIKRLATATLLTFAQLVVAASVLAPTAAFAQRDDRYPFLERNPQYNAPPQQPFNPFGGLFQRNPTPQYERPPSVRGPGERGPPVDATKAPPARKQDTPATTTMVVMGDSMADWLAYGLEEVFADNSEIGVVRKNRASSGLIRTETRTDSYDWVQSARDILAAEKADFVVMMVGIVDRQSIRERPARPQQTGAQAPRPDQPSIIAPEAPAGPGGTYEFRSEKWEELYSKRIDDTIAALKSKGVPVIWVGLPIIRGARSKADVQYLNDLYRSRAEKNGIIYVDIWDGFVDEDGNYAIQGPDYDGQTRRLRAGDGVHFTKAGALKLAHYVEREIQRLLALRTAPMALPAPDQPQLGPGVRPGVPAPRPVAGPVVPLTAPPSATEDLAGAGPPRTPAGDPVTARVLVNGEQLPAPPGRADNFAWPRPDATADQNEVASPAAAPAPPATAVRRPAPKAAPQPPPSAKKSGQAAANPPPREVR